MFFFRVLAVSLSMFLVTAVSPAFAQRIPSGSYQQSCNNAYVRGGTLTANCSAANGRRITSSTSVNCNGDIGNVNGYLRCNTSYHGGHHNGGGYYGGHLPSGSYQQSCTNARMNGSTLIANCSAANGNRITSSLNVNGCRRNADIGNRNGYLGC